MTPLHRLRHPEPVDGCYGCKLVSISIAPSAMPSRNGGGRAAEVNATEKRWAKDHAAYKRLVANGLQPHDLDGAANMEAKAHDAIEIERGQLATPEQVATVKQAEQEMSELNG